MKTKYHKELLIKSVETSTSVTEVIRKLQLKITGNNHAYITKLIKNYNIDTSHFSRGTFEKGHHSFNKKHWSDILTFDENKDHRESGKILRRALKELGREYKCVECKLQDKWNDKKLVLEVDHINDNWQDNRKENLQFLCPNCHSQKPVIYKKKNKKCLSCNALIKNRLKFCSMKCANKHNGKNIPKKTKIDWPQTSVLKQMVEENNFLQVAKVLGVTDNAVRKRLKNH